MRLSTLFLIVIVGAALFFAGGPWISFRALRAAASANDVQGIAAVTDYHAVRQSLRAQLGQRPANVPPPSFLQDPIGALKGALGQATAPPSPSIDAYLTPGALADLTNAKADVEPKPEAEKFRAGDLLPGVHGSEIRFWDPKRSRIAVRYREGTETIFTFERRGWFDWKLVHIRLPAANERPA